jgi:hypothetical protein
MCKWSIQSCTAYRSELTSSSLHVVFLRGEDLDLCDNLALSRSPLFTLILPLIASEGSDYIDGFAFSRRRPHVNPLSFEDVVATGDRQKIASRLDSIEFESVPSR